MPTKSENIPVPSPIDARVYSVRGQAVMLDSDLADVYEVETGALNRAMKRNQERFPDRYAFQLTQDEWDALRCQLGILNAGRGRHRKYLPVAFTEHGAVMLASVLNSTRAVQASIAVVDAFIRLRHVLDANRALARRIDELAEKVDMHDRTIAVIFHDLQRLIAGEPDPDPERPRERIGFRTNRERGVNRAKPSGPRVRSTKK